MTSERPEAITMVPEAVQLALPLDREASRASQGWRSIEADFPILEVSWRNWSPTARTFTAQHWIYRLCAARPAIAGLRSLSALRAFL